jgi:hypothetical protein
MLMIVYFVRHYNMRVWFSALLISDWKGYARASKRGMSDKLGFPRFFLFIRMSPEIQHAKIKQ